MNATRRTTSNVTTWYEGKDTRMNQTLQHEWKQGVAKLSHTNDELDKLRRLVAMIDECEERYDNLRGYIRGHFCIAFPQLKAKTFHEAHIAMLQAERLRKMFNIIISEISL